jgi:hypothetical protein
VRVRGWLGFGGTPAAAEDSRSRSGNPTANAPRRRPSPDPRTRTPRSGERDGR